jgi:glucokinase
MSLKHVIGLDIGGTKTAVSLWENEDTLIKKIQFPTEGGPEKTIEKIVSAVEELRTEVAGKEISAAGISCGGPLDSERGIVLSPPNLPGWDKIPLVSTLEKKIGVPCFLENDANACALAEWYWGAGKGYRDMVFLTFGTGLGCGLILNGQLYRGACDLAGEVGHIRIAENGPEGYGKRGSWEGCCSGGGISRIYKEITGREETGKHICSMAEKGEKEALRVIESCAFYLGRGIALLVDILNPQCIIIGSIFTRSEKLFRHVMEEVVEKEALPQSWKSCKVFPAKLGEFLGDRAALGVAFNGKRRNGK